MKILAGLILSISFSLILILCSTKDSIKEASPEIEKVTIDSIRGIILKHFRKNDARFLHPFDSCVFEHHIANEFSFDPKGVRVYRGMEFYQFDTPDGFTFSIVRHQDGYYSSYLLRDIFLLKMDRDLPYSVIPHNTQSLMQMVNDILNHNNFDGDSSAQSYKEIMMTAVINLYYTEGDGFEYLPTPLLSKQVPFDRIQIKGKQIIDTLKVSDGDEVYAWELPNKSSVVLLFSFNKVSQKPDISEFIIPSPTREYYLVTRDTDVLDCGP